MKVNLTIPKNSNFEATAKDLKDIALKLVSDEKLLKLLYYNTADALEKDSLTGEEIVSVMSNNIKIVPKIPLEETLNSYIIILFDHFVTNQNNPIYRDNLITFDVVCPLELWKMNDYMLRPYSIMHSIDSIFNNTKLNGIGKVEFVSADSLMLTDEMAGFTVTYRVINDV